MIILTVIVLITFFYLFIRVFLVRVELRITFGIETYSGDLEKLVNERLRPKYKNVWMAGEQCLPKNPFVKTWRMK